MNAGVPSYLSFGVGAESCSNFLASTVKGSTNVGSGLMYIVYDRLDDSL